VKDPKVFLVRYQENLTERIWRLARALRMFELLETCDGSDRGILNQFVEFFGPVGDSLRTHLALNLHSLLDEDSERSLVDYLKKTREHLRSLVAADLGAKQINALRSEIDSQIARAQALQPILRSLKFSRDKYYAHTDRKYFDKPEALAVDSPLPLSDVSELITFCKKTLNWHQAKIIDCPVVYWLDDRGKDELSRLLCFVRRYEQMCDEIIKTDPKGLSEMIKPRPLGLYW
jgi:hypothetical protein